MSRLFRDGTVTYGVTMATSNFFMLIGEIQVADANVFSNFLIPITFPLICATFNYFKD